MIIQISQKQIALEERLRRKVPAKMPPSVNDYYQDPIFFEDIASPKWNLQEVTSRIDYSYACLFMRLHDGRRELHAEDHITDLCTLMKVVRSPNLVKECKSKSLNPAELELSCALLSLYFDFIQTGPKEIIFEGWGKSPQTARQKELADIALRAYRECPFIPSDYYAIIKKQSQPASFNKLDTISSIFGATAISAFSTFAILYLGVQLPLGIIQGDLLPPAISNWTCAASVLIGSVGAGIATYFSLRNQHAPCILATNALLAPVISNYSGFQSIYTLKKKLGIPLVEK